MKQQLVSLERDWNCLKIVAPKSQFIQIKVDLKVIDSIQSCANTMKNLSTLLTSMTFVEDELNTLTGALAARQSQLRREKVTHLLMRVKVCCSRLKGLGSQTLSITQSMKQQFELALKDVETGGRLRVASSAMFQHFLLSLIQMSAITLQTINYCCVTATQMESVFTIGHLLAFYVTGYAIVSRVWSLCKNFLHSFVKWYKQLLPMMHLFPKGLKWLEDDVIWPKNLIAWLGERIDITSLSKVVQNVPDIEVPALPKLAVGDIGEVISREDFASHSTLTSQEETNLGKRNENSDGIERKSKTETIKGSLTSDKVATHPFGADRKSASLEKRTSGKSGKRSRGDIKAGSGTTSKTRKVADSIVEQVNNAAVVSRGTKLKKAGKDRIKSKFNSQNKVIEHKSEDGKDVGTLDVKCSTSSSMHTLTGANDERNNKGGNLKYNQNQNGVSAMQDSKNVNLNSPKIKLEKRIVNVSSDKELTDGLTCKRRKVIVCKTYDELIHTVSSSKSCEKVLCVFSSLDPKKTHEQCPWDKLPSQGCSLKYAFFSQKVSEIEYCQQLLAASSKGTNVALQKAKMCVVSYLRSVKKVNSQLRDKEGKGPKHKGMTYPKQKEKNCSSK